MPPRKVYRAIGLMSGTSLDGIDAALIETDGHDFVRPLGFATFPYEEGSRARLRACLGKREFDKEMMETELDMTLAHIRAMRELEWSADIIGFHGQTVYHAPGDGITLQIGNAALLARETGIDTIADFRSADVNAGGQGAPLLPLYHRALAKAGKIPGPVAILNIGGVANVTWLKEDEILAFDTGPGNALIDDWVKQRTGADYDTDGALAHSGHSADHLLKPWYAHPYFRQKPPKSLDRNAWDISPLQGLNDADGAATLAVFTAETILSSVIHMPQKPRAWYVTGGGRKNKTIMNYLHAHLNSFFRRVPVRPVEILGWNGDALEAEGFAYLAVRSLLGEPLSLPTTTGVPAPQTGGALHRAQKNL
jgi:anhydro-N-acetylmuramic acid kinase